MLRLIISSICVSGALFIGGFVFYAQKHGILEKSEVPEAHKRLFMFWKAGDLLAGFVFAWKKKHGYGKTDRREALCSELYIHEPGTNTLRRHEAERYGVVILIVGLCLVLGALTGVTNPKGNVVTSLRRDTVGGSAVTYELWVQGLEDEDVRVNIDVEEQRYGDVDALFDAAYEEAISNVFAEGDSAECVRNSLVFRNSLCGGIVSATWDTLSPRLIGYDGTVTNEDIPDDGVEGALRLVLRYEEETREYTIDLTVMPPDYSDEEQRLHDLALSIEAEEGASRLDAEVDLPSEWDGRQLTFVEEADKVSVFQLLMLGALAAASWFFLADRNLIERSKKRSEQMETDYPEIVLKLAVLLRAGLNVRGAWERIVDNYKSHEGKSRYVYEEMGQTLIKMQGGRAEGDAYLEFGRRTHLHSYLKLSSLLEQNLKKGGKNLVRLLENEAEISWHDRKDAALKKGEEAGTKMILPMMMLLIVVMIVIMAPAMFSFY